MKLSPRDLSRVSLTFLLSVAVLLLCVLLLARTSTTQAESPIDYASKGRLVAGEGLSEAAGRQDLRLGDVQAVLPELQRPPGRERGDGGSRPLGTRPLATGGLQ